MISSSTKKGFKKRTASRKTPEAGSDGMTRAWTLRPRGKAGGRREDTPRSDDNQEQNDFYKILRPWAWDRVLPSAVIDEANFQKEVVSRPFQTIGFRQMAITVGAEPTRADLVLHRSGCHSPLIF